VTLWENGAASVLCYTQRMQAFLHHLNVPRQCRDAHLGLWSCSPFLFLVLGFVNVVAMITSYLFATRFIDEPEVAALIVIVVSTLIFIIGIFIIQGFDRIAEANRMKSEFIAIVSHQLRSPLAVFKWTIDAMTRAGLREISAGDTRNSEFSHLDILRENAEKMIQLVNMLLEVSRIEAGRLILKVEPVRLDLVTEEIVHSYDAYARASNITIDYAAAANMAPVRGDREKLKMVIQNLIDNAIRYSRGGGRVAITIAPSGSAEFEWQIQDSGVGIPKLEQKFVFQKFFRSEQASQHATEGSGLGLYIARSVIISIGGTIGFHSEEGKGSTFWFRLPRYQTVG